jgi:hypothetical protein
MRDGVMAILCNKETREMTTLIIRAQISHNLLTRKHYKYCYPQPIYLFRYSIILV